MSLIRSATALLVGAALTIVAGAPMASAADMPVKAPPPAPLVGASVPLDVHGYADITFANTRVTGGGLYLYNRGYLHQYDTGLSLDLYKNPTGFINGITAFGGIWNEFWSSPGVGHGDWQEMDWWAGLAVKFAQHWKLTAQHLQFKFPGGATDYNYVFQLGFDDSFLGWPITWNPYVTLFYNAAGPSTVILGNNGHTTRFDVGVSPTVNLMKYTGMPLTLSAPTWFTVGPSSYWNRNDGTTNLCGPTTTTPCALSNFGYVTTGLQARYALDAVVPKRLGNWYIKGGVQYYSILNDALLATQTPTGTNVAASFPAAHHDIVVWSGGIGFTF